MTGVHAQSIETIGQVLGDTCGIEHATADETTRLRTALRTLMARGFTLGIARIAGTVGGGSLEGQLHVELKPTAGGDNAPILLARVLLRQSTRGAAQALFTANEAVDDTYTVVPSFSVWAVGLSIVYVAAMPVVGFMIASIVYMLALGWILSMRTPRALLILTVVAVALGAGIDLGFRAMLIDLP